VPVAALCRYKRKPNKMNNREKNVALLEANGDGVLCFAGTSVPFDAFVHALNKGYTAQEVANRFPELTVADVRNALLRYLSQGIEGFLPGS
jgi:uncharacterized protein (DUF433 family)